MCHVELTKQPRKLSSTTGFLELFKMEFVHSVTDRCADIKCHENGYCREGRCHCHEGFEGDGYWECRALNGTTDPCAGVQCHPHAHCEAGYCRCLQGYVGDGYGDCRKETNGPGYFLGSVSSSRDLCAYVTALTRREYKATKRACRAAIKQQASTCSPAIL
ncbi:uncharacterized protein DEA37_0005492 [Paragonimus westermani]|uniref:EGF-like domain-containing protein n=1 Tax=Paragonimus westermani TaxID=34504 RepID=A0A5J4P1D9_9TREM|nr:uncharacterized protein DEA37_0005492 [Paragonimus westermani]